MRALAVVTPSLFDKIEDKNKHYITIDNLQIPLAFVEGNTPSFDENDPQFGNLVLVQKIGFSLNYRDLGIIEMAWSRLQNIPEDTYYPIGSDFSGRVIKTGKNVIHLMKGDIVIANSSFPESLEGTNPGIPSNHSSRELEIYHKAKLIKIPEYIPGIDASSLGIGTQTSMSMINKANIKEGDNVLITSVTSNTSFFLLNCLWGKKCNVYGFSYSGKNTDSVKDHFPFIKEIFTRTENTIPDNLNFDVVLDAFSDTYLGTLSTKLNFNARYVTCGIFNQSSKKIQQANNTNLSLIIANLMSRNVTLIGNCLGNTSDINEGLKIYKKWPMKIEKIFSHNDSLSDFIIKTYNLDQNKFGKVVYQYH